MDPKSLSEWQDYIRTLSGADLLSKAMAANQVGFVRMLEQDGLSPVDVTGVFKAFADQLLADHQEPPGRVSCSYVNYGALMYPANLSVEVVQE